MPGKIVYYVACSLDGYIAGKNDDISRFAFGGPGVEQYKQDLQKFKTVIMGRRTYEFGYQYGLEPGQAAYPHMDHHIFSESLKFSDSAQNVFVEKMSIDRVKEIAETANTDVYLCGGGAFAGWLLDNDLIDVLKLKLNPIVLGGGIPIFGSSEKSTDTELFEKQEYADGLQILSYRVIR
ncbi:dihydrofolate reductase [Lewinellaceae bacterium SD302]|nr:dihydrofolate reductase [Lewinellaceae bacterium SD302]